MESPHDHDARLRSILEILGSYFVDVYYNHIYISAKNADKNLTEDYVRQVKAFIRGVKTDQKAYSSVIQNLHKYSQRVTRRETMSFAEFVDRVVSCFVPEEYFNKFTSTQKDEVLGNIVTDLVATLGAHCVEPDALRRVIDNHDVSPMASINLFKDQARDVLQTKRAMIIHSFVSEVAEVKNQVPREVAVALKDRIRKLEKDAAALGLRSRNIKEQNAALAAACKEHSRKEKKYRQLISLLFAQLEQAADPRRPFPPGVVGPGQLVRRPLRGSSDGRATSEGMSPNKLEREGPPLFNLPEGDGRRYAWEESRIAERAVAAEEFPAPVLMEPLEPFRPPPSPTVVQEETVIDMSGEDSAGSGGGIAAADESAAGGAHLDLAVGGGAHLDLAVGGGAHPDLAVGGGGAHPDLAVGGGGGDAETSVSRRRAARGGGMLTHYLGGD